MVAAGDRDSRSPPAPRRGAAALRRRGRLRERSPRRVTRNFRILTSGIGCKPPVMFEGHMAQYTGFAREMQGAGPDVAHRFSSDTRDRPARMRAPRRSRPARSGPTARVTRRTPRSLSGCSCVAGTRVIAGWPGRSTALAITVAAASAAAARLRQHRHRIGDAEREAAAAPAAGGDAARCRRPSQIPARAKSEGRSGRSTRPMA